MAYDLYSNFDIEQHKKTFVHYLEVVIDENGKVMYAVPSHQEKIIALACEKLNATREELNSMCPQEYCFDFMTWLCKISGACAVWEKFIQADKMNEQQIKALQMLKDNGLYWGKLLEWRINKELDKISGLDGIVSDMVEQKESEIKKMVECILKNYPNASVFDYFGKGNEV